MEGQGSDVGADGVYDKAKASRFQFKSSAKRPAKPDGSAEDVHVTARPAKRHRSHRDDESRHSKRESRRRHKHRHRSAHDDRHPTSTRDGTYYDPDHRHRESLYDDIDTNDADAFRESLFDALADDEGAAYWEGVYGQPVHIYPDLKPGPDGKLERMSEEEYADYVRTRMWEKSHQHIVQEREAKEKARQQRKQQRNNRNDDDDDDDDAGNDNDNDNDYAERQELRKRMADSLRRGQARKEAKLMEAAWHSYTQKWADFKLHTSTTTSTTPLASNPHIRDIIPWPVPSGLANHVAKDEIERFFLSRRGSHNGDGDDNDMVALLKAERVRWHPDKMQQRFGELRVEGEVMGLVTAVFQVVDGLWDVWRKR